MNRIFTIIPLSPNLGYAIIERLPEKLQTKYPESVLIDESGFVRFEPYTYVDESGRTYKVEHDRITGDATDDYRANKAMGIKGKPDGYTWHHLEDAKTLILVPEDLHDAVRHTGGRAVNKRRVK